jgi:hypothetical protein
MSLDEPLQPDYSCGIGEGKKGMADARTKQADSDPDPHGKAPDFGGWTPLRGYDPGRWRPLPPG